VTLVAAITQNVTLAEQATPATRSLPETIAEPYRSIVRECLQLDPKRRASLQQIQARLQPASEAAPPTLKPAATVPVAPVAASSRARVNRTPIIAIAGVVIAIVIIFSLIHSRGNNVQPSNPDTAAPAVVDNKPSASPGAPARAPASRSGTAKRNTGLMAGEVKQRVIPDIPKSARNTIHGTIKVSVHIDVGPAGKVIAAKFKTSGPSRYFAQKAMKAAEQWEFSPRPETTSWLLDFHFRRSGTDASFQPVNR
jgi:TonB family protein